MAIIWEIEDVRVLDVATKAVSVTATRRDSAIPEEVKSYTVAYAIVGTSAQKLAVLDNIWAQHQAAISKQTTIDSFIGMLKVDAKANLEAREA